MPSVLFIEDDPDCRETFMQAVRLFNPKLGVVALSRSPEADELPVGNVDVVVIDLMLMGPHNGVEVAHHLRDNGFTGKLVAMSASRLEMEHARADGAFDDYLDKPFGLNDLLVLMPDSA